MKIAVIGANGKAGSLIAKEAIARGHEVTAIVRDAANLNEFQSKVLVKDLFKLSYDDLKENEVVVDAFAVWAPDMLGLHQTSLKHLCDILSGKPNRLIVVGGAGSLYVNPEHTMQLQNIPSFPDAFKPTASNMAKALDELKTRKDVKWTYLSPAADFQADGIRTGKYILGGEALILNDQKESVISYADYAVAMIDEAEKANNIHKRFSVVANY